MRNILLILLLPIVSFAQPCFTGIGNQTTNYIVPKATIDLQTLICIPQTTASIVFTLDAPTTLTGNKNITIANVGTISFTVTNGGVVAPGTGVIMRWSGSVWISTGGGTQAVVEPANTVRAGPASGSPALATFRSLVTNDIPSLPYAKISDPPNIPTNTNQLTNGSDFATNTSVTSGLASKEPVIASGTTSQYWRGDKSWQTFPSFPAETDPVWTSASTNYYNKTQADARYLQSFTEMDPQFDTKFSGKSTTNLTEGTNLYYTASRFNTSFSGKTTADLTENTNLYYTSARFNTAFAAKSTTDLTEGTNLYYTATRFNTAFSGKSTTDLTEGTKLYYTDARARLSVSATGTGLSYNNTTGVFQNTAPDQPVTITAGRGLQVSGVYPNFTVSMVAPTYSTTARALNSNFTPNATKETFAFYTITCSVTNPLLVGTSTASVFLEYSTNAGSSWNAVTSQANSSGVGLTVTVQLNNGQTGVVSGIIPAGALARLRSVTAGTASVTIVSTFEMVY